MSTSEPTFNERIVTALEAAIEKRASKTQLEQSVEGVAVKYMTLAEMTDALDRYRRKVRKEQARKSGTSSFRTVKSRFCN